MRISQTDTAKSYLILSLLSAGLFVSSTTLALPNQGAFTTVSKETGLSTKTETKGSAKNPVLVRNTTARPESVVRTTTATVQKNEDKKTISRCWQRLMNMVREVNHAHGKKTN